MFPTNPKTLAQPEGHKPVWITGHHTALWLFNAHRLPPDVSINMHWWPFCPTWPALICFISLNICSLKNQIGPSKNSTWDFFFFGCFSTFWLFSLNFICAPVLLQVAFLWKFSCIRDLHGNCWCSSAASYCSPFYWILESPLCQTEHAICAGGTRPCLRESFTQL